MSADLRFYLKGEVLSYAQRMGGTKANGEPFTERDADVVVQRILQRIESGQITDALRRDETGIILPQ